MPYHSLTNISVSTSISYIPVNIKSWILPKLGGVDLFFDYNTDRGFQTRIYDKVMITSHQLSISQFFAVTYHLPFRMALPYTNVYIKLVQVSAVQSLYIAMYTLHKPCFNSGMRKND